MHTPSQCGSTSESGVRTTIQRTLQSSFLGKWDEPSIMHELLAQRPLALEATTPGEPKLIVNCCAL